MTDRFLVDTNVFLYARGAEHPYRVPCRQILQTAANGVIALECSVEVVQEYAHVLLRRAMPRDAALDEADEIGRQCRLHPFDPAVLSTALDLLRRHPDLGVRDAVHASTALSAGLDAIISTDRVFDQVAALRRVDPGDARAPWAQGG